MSGSFLKTMKRANRKFNLFLILLASAAVVRAGQNAAPSSHFVFDDNFEGDILTNEVRVPKSGVAMYTYYETLGWSCLLYTSPSPRDVEESRMPSSA